MNDNMELGRRIASYRKLKRLTQFKLAESVGVSKGYIAAIEEGRRPQIKTLARIAELLDIKSELLFREDD